MFYDHALTFGDEVRLLWAAPSSFAKWMFLINRYLTALCLVLVANGACDELLNMSLAFLRAQFPS